MTEGADYRPALGRFLSGVTVVTAAHGEERYAMTASALTSVSLDPILLLVCFGHDSETGRAVREAGRFGLNMLGADDAELARTFAVHRGAVGDQLDSHELREGPRGVPLLAGAMAHSVCVVERVVRGGDHDIVVGEVEWIEDSGVDQAPLVYYEDDFWTLTPFDAEPQPGPR